MPTRGRDPHPHSRWGLVAIGALAAPAILSYVVFLPMPGGIPMSLYPAFRALVRVAGLAPLCALAASAALVLAWHRDWLSRGDRLVALGLVVAAWVIGLTTAGRLDVATRF